eukprot:5463518-Amphidinium_carterae.1
MGLGQSASRWGRSETTGLRWPGNRDERTRSAVNAARGGVLHEVLTHQPVASPADCFSRSRKASG